MKKYGVIQRAGLYLATGVLIGVAGCGGNTSLNNDPSTCPVSDRSPLSAFADNETSKDGMDELHKNTGKTLKTLVEIFKDIGPAY